ncbi:MAG: sulfatase [Acidobacteriota bacterium]
MKPGLHTACLLFMMGVCLASLSCAGQGRRGISLVLITFDTTRADRISAYGGPSGLTPHWDEAARQGVLFLKAQAQAAVTPVSHASLLTGLNPYHHGLRTLHGNRDYRLRKEVTTLAQRLGKAGFETAAFISAFPCSTRFTLDRGFETFDEQFVSGAQAHVGQAGNVSTGLAQRGAAATTDAVLRWLSGRRHDRPFFLWVHYFDPHDPLLRPPQAFLESYMQSLPHHGEMERLLSTDLAGFVAKYTDKPELMRPWLRRLYDAEIAYADAQLGRLLKELKGSGLKDRMVLALTADHGEGLGDHGWWGHGILYQEQLHVPMVLEGPGLPQGLRVHDRVRLVDLAPTLLDLSGGLQFEQLVDGISLLPLIRARALDQPVPSAAKPGPAYADSVTLMEYGAVFSRQAVEKKDDQLHAWIDSDLKWIYHRLRPAESELYDLAADPQEEINLTTRRPRAAARLQEALKATHPLTVGIDFSRPADPEVLKRLRSLGYLTGPSRR